MRFFTGRSESRTISWEPVISLKTNPGGLQQVEEGWWGNVSGNEVANFWGRGSAAAARSDERTADSPCPHFLFLITFFFGVRRKGGRGIADGMLEPSCG